MCTLKRAYLFVATYGSNVKWVLWLIVVWHIYAPVLLYICPYRMRTSESGIHGSGAIIKEKKRY